jgi:hypothetical protein
MKNVKGKEKEKIIRRRRKGFLQAQLLRLLKWALKRSFPLWIRKPRK